jgi:antitoxin StbD
LTARKPGPAGISTMESILARASIGISELKTNPTAAIEKAQGPVAVLNRNKPVAYLIPAAAWEAICERLEDIELAKIVKERAGEKAVSVKLEDL